MPTPNGVNYLLRFLVISSNSPIIRNKNQKWTFSLMSLYFLFLHWHICIKVTLFIRFLVCGYKDTQNLDERNDLSEKLVEKVLRKRQNHCTKGLHITGFACFGSEAELAAVPFQRLLLLFSVVAPFGVDDVFACARQGVGDTGSVVGAVDGLESRRVAFGHLLRGVVVAVENESVELPRAVGAVREASHVVGEEFVLSVGLVPVAHLFPAQVAITLIFIADIAVFLVNGEFVFLAQLFPSEVGEPYLLHGVSGFVEHVVTFFVPVVGREEGCSKVADGGLRSLVVHSDGLLCRQRKCAAYKNG